MHASQLTELGALIATHADSFIHGSSNKPQANVESYWSASKCRLDRWARALKMFKEDVQRDDPQHNPWPAIRVVVGELLMSELLTRVWAAVVCVHDRLRKSQELESVVRSVWIGHLEARHRALSLILYGQQHTIPEAAQLNRLRRRVERWTDLVLGRLQTEFEISEFAFDPVRVRDFARDLADDQSEAKDETTWNMLISSLQAAFRADNLATSANPDMNEQIASSILDCFPGELLQWAGEFESLWLTRLHQTAAKTQQMLDEYLSQETPQLQ